MSGVLPPTPVLELPAALEAALWSHARREAPRECVGALGGLRRGENFVAHALYPLPNIAPTPERAYLADAGAFLRALKAMRAGELTLVGLYHSHPDGPAGPSETDRRLAAYPVPHLIADLRGSTLRAFSLPLGPEIRLCRGAADAQGGCAQGSCAVRGCSAAK